MPIKSESSGKERAILPCIVCDKVLESAIPGAPGHNVVNQPYKGTVFTSRGHYGSTVWDPVTGSAFIEITLCDECLVARKEKVLHCITRQSTEHDYSAWSPESD